MSKTLVISDAADIRDAPAPFNNPRADIILRTCDGVDYWVRSSILAEASSVYEDMFDIAKAAPAEQYLRKAGIPVVSITETSEITSLLLRFCYPVSAPIFTTFAQVRGVLAAVDKYLMESLTEAVKKHLTDFALQGAHPLLVYITAYSYGYEDVALAAARQAVVQKDEQEPLQDTNCPELAELTAGAYHRLLEFYRTGDANVLPSVQFLSADLPKAATRPPMASYRSTEWASNSASPYPFGMPSADLTLYTCDGIHFEVHADLLRIASPYLRFILSGESPSQPGMPVCERNKQGRIITITLPEHSRTISTILQYVYPAERPDAPTDPHAASLLLKAVKKYDFVAALEPIRSSFLNFAEVEPLVVFAIACAHHWPGEARHAALVLMRRPMDNIYVEEMEGLSATSYRLLLQHRTMTSTVAEDFMQEVLRAVISSRGESDANCTWLPRLQDGVPFVWVSCRGCPADSVPGRFYNPFGLRKWWCKWFRQVSELLRSTPCGQTILDPQALGSALTEAACICKTCGPVAAVHLQHFCQQLSVALDVVLSREMPTRLVFF
ncbi:hypothetical protein DAEQUDRAFT_726905 [Daedalea quercina L-15889]|uniref:BTB domain-containing protein n=1 Tax=Daedalea quercina L-15889 TaxID=1314783 RepID=A0A165QDN2_9APHY|nr:hypothetical protein DAEQUDRAFT_726905 [Daedalea quercina L-15889]